MDPDRLARLEDLFHRAVELDASERERLLDAACAGDDELRREVETLLGYDHRPDSFAGVELHVTDETVALEDDAVPESIGPYRLLQRLGEGGFAIVYAAQQIEPVRRRVAVKVLKAGLDTGAVLARFEAERQALALMDHPSIARVYDAGRTEGGRSYFVMELVEGEPIHRYCDQHGLGLRDRVQLMITVCQAVQHAHQKGLIHRDLKPSNILVTTIDGRPVPKVIDFGIAKAVSTELGAGTMLTQMGQFVGTPEYSSPEQADPGSLDVDTRSDVYSLGVVTYELLTGHLPFPRESLLRAGLVEVLRVLREEEPPSPSTRIRTLASDATEAATRRGTTTSALRRQLRGDLDWIVLKSLEKDRGRRYETATGLGHDLQRFLDGDPVLAGPPSTRYRVGKFLRRHRWAALATSVFVLMLVTFAVTMAVQNQRIAAARDRAAADAKTAERVSGFLTSLFEFADPGESRGREVSARELLDTGAERLQRELTEEPRVRANLLVTLGQVYRRIDEEILAASLLEEAVSLREAALGHDHLETVYARVSLAIVYTRLERSDDAEVLLRRSVADLRRLIGEEHENTQRTLTALANLYRNAERRDEALPLLESILRTRQRNLGPDHRDTLYAMFNLGGLHAEAGRDDLAEPLLRQSLERLRVVRGEDHPNVLLIMREMGELDARQGRLDAAQALLEEALAGQERVLGPESSDATVTRRALDDLRARMSTPAPDHR